SIQSPIVGILTDSSTFTFCLYTPPSVYMTSSPSLSGLSTHQLESSSRRRKCLKSMSSYLFSAFQFAFLLALHATNESKEVTDIARVAHIKFCEAFVAEGEEKKR